MGKKWFDRHSPKIKWETGKIELRKCPKWCRKSPRNEEVKEKKIVEKPDVVMTSSAGPSDSMMKKFDAGIEKSKSDIGESDAQLMKDVLEDMQKVLKEAQDKDAIVDAQSDEREDALMEALEIDRKEKQKAREAEKLEVEKAEKEEMQKQEDEQWRAFKAWQEEQRKFKIDRDTEMGAEIEAPDGIVMTPPEYEIKDERRRTETVEEEARKQKNEWNELMARLPKDRDEVKDEIEGTDGVSTTPLDLEIEDSDRRSEEQGLDQNDRNHGYGDDFVSEEDGTERGAEDLVDEDEDMTKEEGTPIENEIVSEETKEVEIEIDDKMEEKEDDMKIDKGNGIEVDVKEEEAGAPAPPIEDMVINAAEIIEVVEEKPDRIAMMTIAEEQLRQIDALKAQMVGLQDKAKSVTLEPSSIVPPKINVVACEGDRIEGVLVVDKEIKDGIPRYLVDDDGARGWEQWDWEDEILVRAIIKYEEREKLTMEGKAPEPFGKVLSKAEKKKAKKQKQKNGKKF